MEINLCRICGGAQQLKNILDQDTEMKNKLLLCLNISIYPGDLLPKLICAQCDSHLDISYCLRKKSEATNKLLLMKVQTKEEEIKRDPEIPAKEIKISNSEDIGKKSQNEKIDFSQPSECLKDSFKNEKKYCNNVLAFKIETEQNIENNQTILKEEIPLMDHGKLKYEQGHEVIETLELNDLDYEHNDSCVTRTDSFINKREDDYENTLKEITKASTILEYCSIDLISSESSANDCWDDHNNQVNATLSVGNFNCDTCHEAFTTKNEYSLHIKEHGVERYQCIQCCKFFPSRFRLKRHEEIHNEIPPHQCSYCNRNYRALYNLKRHISTVHLGKKSLECNVCKVNFSRVDVLKRHLQLHSDEEKFKCLLCPKSFKTNDYLRAHQKKHTLNSERPKRNKGIKKDSPNRYQCGYCGKLFRSSFSYKNHVLIHTNDKPYKCDSCSKNFRTIAALTIHQRVHDDYRPYQCDVCLKSFRQAAHLKEHKILHLNSVPKHICAICQASFAKKSNLKAHIRTHTKQKLFKCADCSAEFNYIHLLQRHASEVHFRSVHKVYTTNDEEETIQNYGGIEDHINLETEMCHYIDSVADDDEDELDTVSNFVDLVKNDEHLLNDKQSLSLNTEPNMVYIDTHCPLYQEGLVFNNNIDADHTEEQTVNVMVTEELKLSSAIYNAYEME